MFYPLFWLYCMGNVVVLLFLVFWFCSSCPLVIVIIIIKKSLSSSPPTSVLVFLLFYIYSTKWTPCSSSLSPTPCLCSPTVCPSSSSPRSPPLLLLLLLLLLRLLFFSSSPSCSFHSTRARSRPARSSVPMQPTPQYAPRPHAFLLPPFCPSPRAKTIRHCKNARPFCENEKKKKKKEETKRGAEAKT